MSAKHYRDLIVWQKSVALVEEIYSVTASFPKEERFGIISQLRRAAVSVPSNIAEGNARRSRLDYARFIAMALGSVAEIETQTEIASRLGFLAEQKKTDIFLQCEEIGRMLIAIERKLKAYSASKVSESSDLLVPGP